MNRRNDDPPESESDAYEFKIDSWWFAVEDNDEVWVSKPDESTRDDGYINIGRLHPETWTCGEDWLAEAWDVARAWIAQQEVDALKARVEELEGALRLILIQDQFRIVHPGDIEGTNHYNAFDVDVIINEALRDG